MFQQLGKGLSNFKQALPQGRIQDCDDGNLVINFDVLFSKNSYATVNYKFSSAYNKRRLKIVYNKQTTNYRGC